MTRQICLLTCLILSPFLGFTQQTQLATLIADDGIPGIQLEYHKGPQVRTVYLGTVRRDTTQTVTANTIFEAASLSKPVFTYAVLKLVDRGVLNLDTPLLHYLGRYPRIDSLDNRYEKITARMVLSHRTGFPNWGDDQHLPLLFTPDSCFSYSGEGFLFLQRAVEKLTGQTLDEVVAKEVFIPLGMKNSSYQWQSRFDTISAFGAKNGKWHMTQNAASSLLTNAHDYSLFLQALLADNKGMFTKYSQGNWFRHEKPGVMEHIGWGLGVGLTQDDGHQWIWHWGDNGDFKCFFLLSPDTHESLVYFTYNRYGLQIMPDVLSLFFGNHTWWPSKWLSYDFEKADEMRAFRAKLKQEGYVKAGAIIKKAGYHFPEDDLNNFGFMLMRNKQINEALEIFKLNLELYPGSANGYDSLAEAYEAAGNKQLALVNFKKALELNPKNKYAAEHIKLLEK
ncbi:serine hydrolase [Chitinophaga sp.]|uniref:serine hydrolase n=1 Tax=Chitinophaga sp. TaxID=1869181 RepID=UPI0031D641A9